MELWATICVTYIEMVSGIEGVQAEVGLFPLLSGGNI
jgi:hypothetical protein